MTPPNLTAPEQVNIVYRQHKETGLLCAYSADLDGLMVFGRTPDQLCAKLPLVVTELVKARTGERIEYHWSKDDREDEIAPGYVSEELGRLVAMASATSSRDLRA